jgi:uncharacterized membrane protein
MFKTMQFIRLLRTVLWSFFGIRKRSGLEADLKAAKPLHLVFVAILVAGVFIAILLLLVTSALRLLK